MTAFFASRAEAEAFAASHGARAVDVSVTSWVLPETFWAALRASQQPAMALVRAHAEARWKGDIQSAWADACDGMVRGVSASVCAAIDDAQRVTRHTDRWMVTCDAPAKPEVVGYDPQDDHVGWGFGND